MCSRWEKGRLTVLGDGVAAENLNDISLVTLFEAPGLRCLSSGDGEKAVEDAVLASGADVHADVSKRRITARPRPIPRHFWMRCARRPLWSPAARAISTDIPTARRWPRLQMWGRRSTVPIRREQSLRM